MKPKNPRHEAPNFDGIARAYRWMEYFSFGIALERCRFYFLPQLTEATRILAIGDGDGRFLSRLLARNTAARADAVDISNAMLVLLQERVKTVGAADRLQIHRMAAQDFQPTGAPYDVVVTHFFLDCLSQNEVKNLLQKLSPHLTDDATWVISEFAIPPKGLLKLAGMILVSSLYFAFRWLTDLRVRTIPQYDLELVNIGFQLSHQQSFFGGILRCEFWKQIASPKKQSH